MPMFNPEQAKVLNETIKIARETALKVGFTFGLLFGGSIVAVSWYISSHM